MEIMPDALDTILSIQNWEYQDSSLETLMLELFPDIFIPSNSDENQTVPTPQPVVKQQVPLCQDFVQPTQLHTNAGAYVQGQYLANQQPVYNVPRIAASTLPAAPPQMYNVPANQFPGVFPQNLRPVGYVNGEVVYELPNYLSPHIINVPVVTKHEKEDKSYVKKPPNAFMLYRREQRFNVVTQYNITDSAMINKILGEKWKSLSKEEQSKYYNEAEIEKQQHLLQHPEWSAKDNYGKKKKRNTAFNEVQVEGKKRKRNTAFNEVQVAVSAEEPAADSQQAREPYVLSTCQNIATAVAPRCYMTQPYMTQSNGMQSIPQTGMTQSYMTQSNRMQSIPQTGMTQSYMAQLIPQTGITQSNMTQSNRMQSIPQSYMTQCIPQTGTAQSYMTQCIPQTGTTQSYMNQSIPQIDMTQLQWCSSPTRPTTVDLVQYF